MSFGQSIAYCYRNYVNFEGRASRSQFWWFYLYYAVIAIVIYLIVDRLLLNGSVWLSAVWFLANILPLLAAGCRRLHDVGKSGWWQLLLLITCIGFIIMAVFWAQPGQPVLNQYGDPAA